MTFFSFAQYLQKLENISSRLEMTGVLSEMFLKLAPEERRPVSYLLQGSLVPGYQSLEFQFSTKMLLRALSSVDSSLNKTDSTSQAGLFGDVSPNDTQKITLLFKQLGDEGAVAAEILKDSSPKDQLSIINVYELLRTVAETSGVGSQETKLQKVVSLLLQSEAISARYIVRIIMGKMRLGVGTKTILDALSWAVAGDKSLSIELEEAYQKQADVGVLAELVLDETPQTVTKALSGLTVALGIPVVPQLCQRLHTPQEIIDKLGKVYVEPKYDGLRVQIHVDTKNQTVSAYTRSLENVTHMFPELQKVLKQISADSVILDAEGIGYDPVTNSLLPFQQTITRKRKHRVEDVAASVPIRFYVYDVLFLNGTSLIDKKLQERKELLKDLFEDSETIMSAPYIVTEDPNEIQSYHASQLSGGLEGAVVKKVTAPYQSGRKGWYWVKIKERAGTTGKLSDTVDCIVLGYYKGKGKRTTFGLGALLVGVVKNQDEIVTVTKIGTGMSDEVLGQLRQLLDTYATNCQPVIYKVSKELFPDVWVNPAVVVEVAADEITDSKMHSAGLALRFPRLLKIRTDKTWEQATTVAELKNITTG